MDPVDLIEKGKIKRFFRSRNKLNVPKLVYHITQRAAGKEALFLENDDYMAMLALMKDNCHNHNIQMYAFCLMPNHLHFLLSPLQENLPEAMKNLFSKYAVRFNKKYERKGHLFAGPYRQATILEDSYLLAASLYIHLNPVRAGLASDPIVYRWSSARLYVKRSSRKSFVDEGYILGVLEHGVGAKAKRARELYADLLERGSDITPGEVLEQPEAIEGFHRGLLNTFPSVFGGIRGGRRAIGDLGLELESITEIEKKIEELNKAERPLSPETRRAKKYLIEQLLARGFQKKEIAEKLGVSRKTVYNILRRSY